MPDSEFLTAEELAEITGYKHPGTIHRSSAWGESRPRQAQDVRPAVRVEPFALAAWFVFDGGEGVLMPRRDLAPPVLVHAIPS